MSEIPDKDKDNVRQLSVDIFDLNNSLDDAQFNSLWKTLTSYSVTCTDMDMPMAAVILSTFRDHLADARAKQTSDGV